MRPLRVDTEATLQAELYMFLTHELYPLGRRIVCEAVFTLPDNSRLRADIAILDAETSHALALIEVKRRRPRRPRRAVRQPSKYAAAGIPWRYCNGPDDVTDTLKWARHETQRARNPR